MNMNAQANKDSLRHAFYQKQGIRSRMHLPVKDTLHKPAMPTDSTGTVAKRKIKNTLKQQLPDTAWPGRLKADSLKNITPKKNDFQLHGVISNRADYGTVPYYLPGVASPAFLLQSQGDVKISVKKLPLLFNYFYMNPAGLTGLQNYYTLRFDHETYLKEREEELAVQKNKYLSQLKTLEKQKQNYEQKLSYCETIYSQKIQGVNTPGLGGNADSLLKNSLPDSLHQPLPAISLPTGTTALPTYDSTYYKIQDYRNKIEGIDRQLKECHKAINILSDPEKAGSPGNTYLSRLRNFAGNIKKFEVGLCYPNYSAFLINSLTIKGINAEYATKKYFVHATYGKTITNLQTQQATNSAVINSFQQYNSGLFDFKNNTGARKIAAGKIGIGDKAKTYIAFGALYGTGRQSYDGTSKSSEANIVYEADGRIAYKGYAFSAALAKSVLKQPGYISAESQGQVLQNRSNALQLGLTGTLPYVRTKFSLGYKLVDPFFKSFGVGFIRTDNIRYEAKLEQVISPKLKIGLSYRRDEDNILKLYGYRSDLKVISASTRFKLLKKRLDVNLIYTPIIHTINNLTEHTAKRNRSDMKNAVLAYTPKFKKVITTFTGIFSQYTLQDSARTRHLENFNINATTIFKNSLRLSASAGFFNANVSDSSATPKTILTMFETGYTFREKISAQASVKHSYNLKSSAHQYGAAVNVGFPIKKYFFIELHAEKLITGDFYNSLNTDNLHRYPYYYYTKLNFKF